MVESNIAYGNSFVKDDLPAEADVGVWGGEARKISRPSQKRTFASFTIMPSVDCEEQGKVISEYFENEDPRTQTAILDREDEQVHGIIYLFRASLNISANKSLADKLLALHNCAKEEDSASSGIAIGSLRYFFNFFHLHSKLKCPIISLTPDNNIYARWKDGQGCVFSIHFLSDGNASFVIFKPNDKHPELKMRLSGIATTDILMETVESFGVSDWISDER